MTGDRQEFTWENWLLVAAIVAAFLIVPGIILFRPPTDISFRFAYLILPAVPAVALGIIAVWVALRSG